MQALFIQDNIQAYENIKCLLHRQSLTVHMEQPAAITEKKTTSQRRGLLMAQRY